jgi:hypothetical protein
VRPGLKKAQPRIGLTHDITRRVVELLGVDVETMGEETIERRGRIETRPRRYRRYRYLLECGHVVHRNTSGKQFCYCAACLMVAG